MEIAHIDGFEQNGDADNLAWTCRSCNTQMGAVFARLGIGRRVRQHNPGAESLGQWMIAVMSMKGQSNQMSVPAAVNMIRGTPPARRSEFAREIWSRRRERGTDRPGGEVPF